MSSSSQHPTPVTERLPETHDNGNIFGLRYSVSVLIFIGGQGQEGYLCGNGDWRVPGNYYPVTGVTHWQPMPRLPIPWPKAEQPA